MFFSKKDGADLQKEDVELKKTCVQLKADIEALSKILKEQDVSVIKEFVSIRREMHQTNANYLREIDLAKREIGDVVFSLKNDINKRLLEFEVKIRCEIADRYFTTLESIFRLMREFSFLDKFAQGDKDTLSSLRKSIINPLLDQKTRLAEQATAGKIDAYIRTHGSVLVQRRKELHDEKLKMEREEKNPTEIKKIEGKLEVIDFILKEAQ